MERYACRAPSGAFVRFFILICLLFAFGSAKATGVDWLLGQSQPDGSIALPEDTATSFQSSAEAARALVARKRGDAAEVAATLQFIQSNGQRSVEHLARKIIAVEELEGNPTNLVEQLAASQNLDGGFGESLGFNSTVLDTALALEALTLAGYTESSTLAAAVSFLADQRTPDGGWAAGPRQSASVYVTAQVLRGLWPLRHRVNVGSLIEGAREFLLAAQSAGNGWNNNPLDTAATLLSLYPTSQDKTSLDDARQRLLDWQQADGSWNQDVFVTALSIRALNAAEAPFDDLGVVEGRVLDGDTGAPLAGVVVTLTGGQSYTTTTDESGLFRFEDLEPGAFELQLSLNGYASLTASLQLQQGSRTSFGTLQMLPKSSATQAATVTGQITRADSGAGLEGVMIRVGGTDNETTTNSDGRYQLNGLASGAVTLVASKSGFQSASATASLSAGEVALFSPALSLAPTGVSVEGMVTDEANVSPVPDVTITVKGTEGGTWSTETDASGHYRIDGLSTGSYTLKAEAEGFWPVNGEATANSATVIHFAPTLTELAAEAPDPEGSGGIRVTVRDAVTGQAVAGATVAVETDQSVVSEVTLLEGQASLTGIASGSATLTITAPDFEGWETALDIPSGVLLDFGEIELYPDGYREPASLSGIAVDATTGEPIDGVTVTSRSGHGTTTVVTDADGMFVIEGIIEKEPELSLEKAGYRPVDLGLVVTPGTFLELGSLRMRPQEVQELKADLTVVGLNTSGMTSDSLTLSATGEVVVDIANEGTAVASGSLSALVFHDSNNDGGFSVTEDVLLGTGALTSGVAVGSEASLTIPVEGTLPFRDAPVRVWIDSDQTIVELSEDNNYAGNAGQCAGAEESVSLDLAMCMDASGSVSWSEFQMQLEGTAAAIEDPAIVPHDGSVRLSALQFSSWTRVEVPPTIITKENAAQIAGEVRGIRKLGGGTSIHSCVNKATSGITSASPSSAMKVIDVSTDGYSSRSHAVRASDNAREAGIDTLNSIGVGTGVDHDLLEQIVFPQPVGGERGFVITIDNYADYGDAIAGKVEREVRVADLTAGALVVTDGGIGEPAIVELLVGNAGTGDVPSGTIVRLQGLGRDGVVKWEQDVTLETIAANDSVEVSLSASIPESVAEITVTVDPAQSVGECNRENNRVSLSVATELGSIAASTDASEYGASVDASLIGDFQNQGGLLGRFQPVLLVEDLAGATLARFDDYETVELAPGEQASVTAAWNTASYLADTYHLRAQLLGADGTVVAEDVAPFSIMHDIGTAPAAGLRLTTDRSSYHTTDRVVLESLVHNLTANRILETPVIDLTVTAPDGTPLLQNDLSLSSMVPGGEALAFDELLLSGVVEGHYRARATLRDGNGPVLATGTTTFVVREALASALSGTVSLSDEELHQGDLQTCTFEVSNSGGGTSTDVVVRYMNVGIDDESVGLQQERSLSIEPDRTDTYQRSFDTETLPVGTHACVLRASVDGEWRTLDYASYQLKERPIRIDANIMEGPRGRVLVLLDDNGVPGTAHGQDPHGPDTAARVVPQQARLENLLEQWDWSYTIVADADAFTRELRSGGYVTYLLLNEQVRLDNVVQKELREAVYRGAGLVVAGDHDQRNALLDGLLGISAQGRTKSSVVTFSDMTEPGQALLEATRHTVRVNAGSARTVAQFGNGAPAVTDHSYGNGQAVYVAFDWLAEVAVTENARLERFMRDALDHVHQDDSIVRSGGVLPVRVHLLNQGTATGGRVTLALPPEVLVVDPGNGHVDDDVIQWIFDLGVDQELVYDAWLRVQTASGSAIELVTSIETGESDAYEPYGEPLETTVQVTEAHSMAQLQASFSGYSVGRGDKALAKAERWISKASRAQDSGDLSTAIRHLVNASDQLSNDDGYALLHQAIAETLCTISYRWWVSGTQ